MKFSILLPAYKNNYLKECIDSIICQTYTNYEIIVLNDASPENIKGTIDTYDDDRIRYYENEKNVGAIDVVDNWNKCLEYCSGDYAICMGDDDKLLPNCLDTYAQLISKYPDLSVYHGWTEIIDEQSDFLEMTDKRPEYESVYSLIWHRWKGREQFVGDFLYEVNSLRQKGGFYKLPLAWGSDDITAVIAASSGGIANTHSLVFQYRKNRYTISSGGKGVSDRLRVEALWLEKEWYSNFLKEEAQNSIDEKYRLSLIHCMNKHYHDRTIIYIAKDLFNTSVFRVLYWYSKRNKYHLTFKDIARSTMLYLNAKIKGNF